MSTGQVFLVGAGPGDVGWITVRGLELLRLADVIIFDALANPALLEEAPPTAERIDVGKRAKDHKLTQDQINQLLVDQARLGRRVVRLKGGDPYLFGRGAEEAMFVGQHGIACEVVPGITSGLAAPLAAGIPVTHRELASTLTLVTGHEDPTKPGSAIDYSALAALVRAGGTACFYMGVGRLGAIVVELVTRGLPDSTPAAVVQWGGTPRQRSIRATLAHLEAQVKSHGLGAPAIIVIGAVAGIDPTGLDFFYKRPLFGQRIIVTRTRHQASELRRHLAQLGAEVIEAPTIDLVEPPAHELAAVDQALRDIKQFHWIVLTSANGVTALAARLKAMELDARHLAGLKIAAIGESTAQSLMDCLAIRADLVPTRYVAESLAGELIAKQHIAGKRLLLLRADIARPALPRLLREAGAEPVELSVYHTRRAAALPEGVVEALRSGQVDWVTFSSASTARNMAALLGDESSLLGKCKIASIGPITSDALRELGLGVTVEAQVSTIAGLVDAMVKGRSE